jgi:phage-related protein
MATFPSIVPTYGAQKSSQPKVHQIQFGDGYSQRTKWGLNQNPKRWSLTWEVSEADAETIEAFLDARASDGAAFDWTPLDSPTSAKWICYEWNKTIPYYNRATVTATFTQVYEP